MQRKTISWEFFSSIAALLVVGLLVMGGIQTTLSGFYFSNERRVALTSILDGASALSQTFAEYGSIVTQPIDDETAKEGARSGYALFRTTSNALVFVTDRSGTILISSTPEDFTGETVPAAILHQMDSGKDIFVTGDLNGVYDGKYYTAGRKIVINNVEGYLFAATPMDAIVSYLGDTFSIFVLSAGLMLVISSVMSVLLARRITKPIEAISNAARQLGSGDFTARAPVAGCVELADFATTFNNMATRLQTIDNSRGQFMGNIAHELRTPMTSIKGFIDGMLDGTIPESEYKHYLGVVSQETGRLARLVQNMLDITKLESGEVQVHARTYDLWQTVTDVVLADEQRIEDGKIDIEGLAPDKMPVYADPDFVHQVVYNIVDNAIKFTPPGGVIRFDAHREGEMVKVSIENTGEGISPEALPFVFERFYKEDRSRGLNTRGSGLGLHICKVLITLSGGQIHAESEEGKWCRFVFTLPAEPPRNADGANAPK